MAPLGSRGGGRFSCYRQVTPLGSRGGGRFSCYRQVTPLGSRGGGAVLVLSTGDPAGVPGRRGGSRAIDRRPLWGPDGEGWLSCYRQATPLGSGRRGMALVLSTCDTSGVRNHRKAKRRKRPGMELCRPKTRRRRYSGPCSECGRRIDCRMSEVSARPGRVVYEWRPHSDETGYMVVVSSLLALVLRGKPNESRLGRYRCLRILLSEVSSVEEHTGF